MLFGQQGVDEERPPVLAGQALQILTQHEHPKIDLLANSASDLCDTAPICGRIVGDRS
jgi:hypothetical protein